MLKLLCAGVAELRRNREHVRQRDRAVRWAQVPEVLTDLVTTVERGVVRRRSRRSRQRVDARIARRPEAARNAEEILEGNRSVAYVGGVRRIEEVPEVVRVS